MNSRNPVIAHAHLAAEARRHVQAVPFPPADDADLDAYAFGLWAVVAVLAWSVALWEWAA